MMIRFRHDDDRHRVVDAVFFKGEHDFGRGEEPGARYSIERTSLDDLDDTDREAVAVLVLKRWYKNVVATNESLRDYNRDDGKKEYEAAVRSVADDVVEYAKELLKDGPFGNRDREAVHERFIEEVDVAFNRLEPLDVLRHTDNEDAVYVHGMDVDKADPVKDIAYWAFYQDVQDAVNEEIDVNKRDLGLDLDNEEETEENSDDE